MGRVIQTAQSIVNRTWSAFNTVETKASKAGRLISLNFKGQPIWTPRQYDKLAEESYQRNAVAYRAINEIAKCGGSVPFQLFRGDGDTKKEIENHPLLDLLKKPNPMQSRPLFMQSMIGFYLIAGNSYIERVGPALSQPKELWPKRPDRMQVVAGDKGIPSKYRLTFGGQFVDWRVSQITGQSKILHLKSFHPLNDWYGMSPIEAAATSIDQHNEAGVWNMNRLQHDARPSGALVVDPTSATGLGDEQYDRLKASIEEQMSGPENTGRPLLLEGGLDWKEMGLSAVDSDWLNGMHTSARNIAMVFGMPAQMLGIPGDNTHRNMEEARLWLWEQTIIPLLDFILIELNNWLVPLFGDDLTLAFDLENVPALITRRHQLWDKLNKSDFLTLNEKRKAVGFEPREEADVIRNPKKMISLGEEEPEPEPASLIPKVALPKPNGKLPKPNGKVNA